MHVFYIACINRIVNIRCIQSIEITKDPYIYNHEI